jgi:hypothetical protein
MWNSVTFFSGLIRFICTDSLILQKKNILHTFTVDENQSCDQVYCHALKTVQF